jgi:ribose transport system substrate-binding protein
MAKTLRFIIVPKVADHPWFNEIHKGAQAQGNLLSRELGIEILVESIAPAICDVTEQNAILDQILKLKPTGIAVDPVDAVSHISAINRIRAAGIPVVLFDSPSEDNSITSIGNNFSEQGEIAAERLAKLIGYAGKVAVMQGFPIAPNHKARYESQLAVLSKYPEICVVDGGVDNDDIETAYQQCAMILKSHPDLNGYLCCDASGPIGIAKAIKEARKIREVTVVSMDGIKPILDAIKEGVIESSSSTKPRMQGSMSILLLWQASLGIKIPQAIDTGIDVITQDNVDQYLSELG